MENSNNFASEADYINWAMEKYQLPSVTAAFFDIPADTAFWDRVREDYPWTPDLLPLAEWEGVLIIGCKAPPQEFRFRREHRFVLARPEHLNHLWTQFMHHFNDRVRENTVGGFSIAQTAPPSPSPAPSMSFAEESPALSETPDFDIPEGLFDTKTFTPAHDNASAASQFGSSSAPEGISMPDGFSMPEGFSMDNFSFGASASQSPSELPDMDSASGMPDLGGLQETPVATDNPTGIISTADTAVNFDLAQDELSKITAMPSMPSPAPGRAEHEPMTKSTPMASTPPPVRATPPPPLRAKAAPMNDELTSTTTAFPIGAPSAAKRTSEPIPLEACRNLDALAEAAVGQVLQAFDKAMILQIKKDGTNSLLAWKWSEEMNSPQNSTFPEINLSSPSFFRIVYRSKLPFHGPVSPSTINDRFMGAYLGGVYPPHVTATPIMIGKKLTGVLVGISDSSNPLRNTLSQMERIADDVALQMMRLRDSQAA